MAPLLLWGLGGLLATRLLKYLKKPESAASTTGTTAAKPKTSSQLLTQAALQNPPSAPGQLTPARAAVHGDLMVRCHDPQKLQQAGALFGHEGLPWHARALFQKASMVQNMMKGAQDIVERSRAGDQHAMAIAKGIGDQARAGNKRAQLSWKLIEQYSKQQKPQKAA